MADLARSALWYARHGWRVFPCIPGRKEPAVKGWQRQATTDERQVRRWWSEWPGPAGNIGIACGPASGLYVLDVDQHQLDGEQSLILAIDRCGDLPAGPVQRTGSGGRQLFYRYPDGLDCPNTTGNARWLSARSRRGFGPGVDTRGKGGFVVVPPSIHPCGDAYRWLTGPHEAELQPLPATWIARLKRVADPPRIEVPLRPIQGLGPIIRERAERLIDRVKSARPGNRNDELNRVVYALAMRCREGLMEWAAVYPNVRAAALQAGLDPVEVERTIRSARTAVLGQ